MSSWAINSTNNQRHPRLPRLKHTAPVSPVYTPVACLSTKLHKPAKTATDNLLIYRSNMERTMYWTYMLSAFTVLPAAANAAWNFAVYKTELGVMFSDLDSPLLQATVIMTFGGAILFGMYALLSRLMVSIYYNDANKTFTGFYYNWRLTKNKIVFKPKDVKTKAASTALGLMAGNFVIKGRPYLLMEKDFNSPLHFNIMLGITDGKTWKK